MVDFRIKTMLVGVCHTLCFLANLMAAPHAAARLVLWTGSDRRWGPGLSRALHSEISQLVVPGFNAVDLDTSATKPLPNTSALVVSVRLTGECDPQSGRRPNRPERLGYVLLTDGVIAPTMSVNCDAIVCVIKPLLRELTVFHQNALFARALVRVIQHELRHILEQTAGHLSRGVFKPYLNSTELSVPALSSR